MEESSLAKMIRYAVDKHGYISTSELNGYFEDDEDSEVEFSKEVLHQTAHRLQKKGDIYDAGQGWYSKFEEEYSLRKDPIQNDVERINDEFPYLEFCVWSNEQVASHYHHLPTKFMVFVYTEKDTQDAVYDFLISQEKHAYLDPKSSDMENFYRKEFTYIVRSSIPRQPCSDHYATIEKLLVDLYRENENFNLMGEEEFKTIFENIAGNSRIRVSWLLSYAYERNRRDVFEDLVQYLQQNLRNKWAHT